MEAFALKTLDDLPAGDRLATTIRPTCSSTAIRPASSTGPPPPAAYPKPTTRAR